MDQIVLKVIIFTLATWLLSEVLKPVFQKDIRALFMNGKMPSSHTAVTVALFVCLLIYDGITLLSFFAFIMMMIIVRDAFSVRKAVGTNSEYINTLLKKVGIKKKVRVVHGHTFNEVVVGGIIGVIIPVLLWLLFG